MACPRQQLAAGPGAGIVPSWEHRDAGLGEHASLSTRRSEWLSAVLVIPPKTLHPLVGDIELTGDALELPGESRTLIASSAES